MVASIENERRPHREGAPLVGVLALQGNFEAHARRLEECGATTREVRMPEELEALSGLVMPGGETTTLLKLMRAYEMDKAVTEFAQNDGAIFGTCAGAILLATEVTQPVQESLGLMDMTVERNSYGRQVDSFETTVESELFGAPAVPLMFIRAPRILKTGHDVEALLYVGKDPVLVRTHRILAATCHPEMTQDTRIHQYFLDEVVTTRGHYSDRNPSL